MCRDEVPTDPDSVLQHHHSASQYVQQQHYSSPKCIIPVHHPSAPHATSPCIIIVHHTASPDSPDETKVPDQINMSSNMILTSAAHLLSPLSVFSDIRTQQRLRVISSKDNRSGLGGVFGMSDALMIIMHIPVKNGQSVSRFRFFLQCFSAISRCSREDSKTSTPSGFGTYDMVPCFGLSLPLVT